MAKIARRRMMGLGAVASLALAVGRSDEAQIAAAQDAPTAGGEGAIEGRVRDETDRPLAAVPVLVRSAMLADGEAEVETDATGAFRLGELAVGLYDVSIELEGFRKAAWRDLRVEAGRPIRLEVTLARRSAGVPLPTGEEDEAWPS